MGNKKQCPMVDCGRFQFEKRTINSDIESAKEHCRKNWLSRVTVKYYTAENKEKAFIGGAEMDNDILFFFGEHMDALPIYERLEERILKRIPDVKIKVAKTQITFAGRRGFAFVSFNPCRKAKDRPAVWMTVTFGLGYHKESPRIDVATQPYPGRWTHHVMVGTPDEIDGELLGWIQEAAEFSDTKGRMK